MCEFQDCNVDPIVRVTMEDDDEIDLCMVHFDYEVEDFKERFGKGKIYRDWSKKVVPLVIQ